jgi:arylsulfatase A-like enzyme
MVRYINVYYNINKYWVAHCLIHWSYHNYRHNGNDKNMKSVQRDFDEFLGFTLFSKYLKDGDESGEQCYLNDFFDNFLRANVRYNIEHNGGDFFEPDGYLTDYLADEAVHAIEASKENPFFMYLSFTAVHSPLTALKTDYNSPELAHITNHCDRVYAAMIVALDRSVGKILQALKDNGIDDNTMVVFSSDNGAPNYINQTEVNAPFRGWKASFFEGGVRVPLLIQWPNQIPAGISRDALISHIDLYPGIMAAAELPLAHDIDGLNFLPLVVRPASSGNVTESDGGSDTIDTTGNAVHNDHLHETLFWRSDHYVAIRKGDWKLHTVSLPKQMTWLFNLRDDEKEAHNLVHSPEHQGILTELLISLEKINSTQVTPMWPTLSATPVLLDKLFDDEYIPGDEYVYWSN